MNKEVLKQLFHKAYEEEKEKFLEQTKEKNYLTKFIYDSTIVFWLTKEYPKLPEGDVGIIDNIKVNSKWIENREGKFLNLLSNITINYKKDILLSSCYIDHKKKISDGMNKVLESLAKMISDNLDYDMNIDLSDLDIYTSRTKINFIASIYITEKKGSDTK